MEIEFVVNLFEPKVTNYYIVLLMLTLSPQITSKTPSPSYKKILLKSTVLYAFQKSWISWKWDPKVWYFPTKVWNLDDPCGLRLYSCIMEALHLHMHWQGIVCINHMLHTITPHITCACKPQTSMAFNNIILLKKTVKKSKTILTDCAWLQVL